MLMKHIITFSLQKLLVVFASFVVVAVTYTAAHGGTSCNHLQTREFVPAINKELRLVSYWEKITRSPVICVSYCHSDPNCQSVNYHTSSHLCQLNNVTWAQYPDDFITHYGSLYFDASASTSLLSLPDPTPSIDTPTGPSVAWTTSAPSTQPGTTPSSASIQKPSTRPQSTTPSSSELIKTSSADPTAPLTSLPNPTTVSRHYTSISSAINEVPSSTTTAVTTVQPAKPTEHSTLPKTTRFPSEKTFSTPPTTSLSSMTYYNEPSSGSTKESPTTVSKLLTTESLRTTSCNQLLEAGSHVSGIYTIFPPGFSIGLEVYCDMETDGGGWIVIQRRQDGSVDFNRNWTDYRDGFGNLSGEFWLGNENLRILTESNETWQLRAEIKTSSGHNMWSEYSGFEITGANYNLEYSFFNVNSTTENLLRYNKGKPFATPDRSNRDLTLNPCSPGMSAAGWWVADCDESNLNSPYRQISEDGDTSQSKLLIETWAMIYTYIKSCSMKIQISPVPRITSCNNIPDKDQHPSGIYTIFPPGFSNGLEVYCDMETDGGGWIVIQRRQNGSVDFNRTWDEYRNGFGDLSGEFWLGNENLRILTESTQTWQLNVETEELWDKHYWSEYLGFNITGANYNIDYSDYIVFNNESSSIIKGKPFSTADRTNYNVSVLDCPSGPPAAGWWFADDCKKNLNGPYEQISVGGDVTASAIRLGTSAMITSCSMKIRISAVLRFTSCNNIPGKGQHSSGIYTISPPGFRNGLEVYCDMETDGEGWIVIERRQYGIVDFNRTWDEHRDGFGDLSGEYWLGNENLRILTESFAPWQLRVDLENIDGEKAVCSCPELWVYGEIIEVVGPCQPMAGVGWCDQYCYDLCMLSPYDESQLCWTINTGVQPFSLKTCSIKIRTQDQ